MILNAKKTYLQVAINGTQFDANNIISQLPVSDKLILEAGTPFIKQYGMNGVSTLVSQWRWKVGEGAYVIADMKTIDRATTEVEMVKSAGASGIICMASAPVATIKSFINVCKEMGIDSYLDFMGIPYPHKRLREIGEIPDVVLLHRGVDEEADKLNKVPLPIHQINQVLASYNVMMGIAGGDSLREVQSAIFNSAKIVVLWKQFFSSKDFDKTAFEEFLGQVK